MSGHYIKSQLTPDYLTELSFGSGSSSLRLFACSFFRLLLTFSSPFPRHDLHSTTSAECEARGGKRGGRAEKRRPEMKQEWTEKRNKKTRNTECRTMNVELKEGECTGHLSYHLNWN